MRKVRKFLPLVPALVGLFAAGCGQNNPTPPAGGTVPTQVVAIVPPSLKGPFHIAIKDAAQKLGPSLGLEVRVQAPDEESNTNQQVTLVENFINQKAAAISINALEDKAVAGAIRKANDAKIPIFIHNSITPVAGGNVAEYIGYNQYLGAEKLGEYAAKLLGGKGKVYILDGILGFHTTERAGGFKAGLKKAGPGIVIAGEQSAGWDRAKATSIATTALQKDPAIKLFFGCSDEMAIGAALAAKNLGKTVYTLGIDGNPVTLDEIKKGNVTGTLAVYPDKIGETIVKQMSKLFKGEKIPQYLETPSIIVDGKNVDDYKAGKTWTEPVSSQPEEVKGK